MAKDKKDKRTKQLRCHDCRKEVMCSSLGDGLDQMKCGYDSGRLAESCKINLQLDGKAVFEVCPVSDKNEKKDNPPKDDSSKESPPAKDTKSDAGKNDGNHNGNHDGKSGNKK